MPFEIELKAWVDDREAVEKRIDSAASFVASFEKDDTYWFPVLPVAKQETVPVSGIRIRRETISRRNHAPESLTLATYKTKEIRNGIEVNDEKEFAVKAPTPAGGAFDEDAIAAFKELMERLGLAPGISKKKQGRSWRYGCINVELSSVEKLGCFLELEIMADDDKPETVEQARKELLAFLKLAGISEERIETRYYNEMLRKH
ncbi:MAG: class IV adenylate cyclase [Treponema sp.]|jgi:adenylate cyclase class 2|nr:class IV adenylate cyclase [Treponema sp.]